MELRIVRDDLSGPAVAALLREHLENMHAITPPGSVHALDLEALRSPAITFWSAWEGDDLVGCGALKELSPHRGEVKSMRTAAAHRRRGVGARMLEHIIAEARGRGYATLLLETGALAPFAPARALYERRGFVPCGPFEGYGDDPNSAFMRMDL